MRHLRSGLRAVLATAFCAALLAPAALADNGGKPPGERPGNSANAPGHNKDGDGAATPDPPAAPPDTPEPTPATPPAETIEGGEEGAPPPVVQARPDKPANPEGGKPANNGKPKPAPKPRPSATQHPGASDDSGKESSAHSKVLICHATGSATNPYVLISVSVNAWSGGHGHGGHARDVFVDWSWPGDPRQKNDALCPGGGPVPSPPTTTGTTTTADPTTTTSSGPSAPGDPRNDANSASTGGPPAGADGSGPTLAPPVQKAAPPPAYGVLTQSGRLAEVAVRGTLPFTGVPLWALALLGLGLVVLGFAVHRRAEPSPARE